MGLIHQGEIEKAEDELLLVQGFHDQLVKLGDNYKANQLQIEITILNAWLELSKGNMQHALELMKLAAEMESNTAKHPVSPGEILPAHELLGDMLLEMGKYADALFAYETDLETHPHRFNGIYGAALADSRNGERANANEYYKLLIKNSAPSGSQRKEIMEARAYLEKHLL